MYNKYGRSDIHFQAINNLLLAAEDNLAWQVGCTEISETYVHYYKN